MGLTVSFCGESFDVDDGDSFVIGREGDLAVDDNPYLHRNFLVLDRVADLWRVSNVGSQLSATVGDRDGLVQAWLAPGAQLPLVLPALSILFTAGPTTYEIEVEVDDPPFTSVVLREVDGGETTCGRVTLTLEQRLLVVALAEPALRGLGQAGVRLPSNAEAATRLGWTLTKLNRKLDNVCQKLTSAGVRGLHGGADRLATSRRGRLVEYAVSARLVTTADLPLLRSEQPFLEV